VKNPVLGLIVVAVVALGIMGISFLCSASGSPMIPAGSSELLAAEGRRNNLIAGIACLVLATGILVVAVFAFRKRE
jgi:hypothetical protein